VLAPLDLEAGGTWAGLNAKGVFAGLTNLRPASMPSQEQVAGSQSAESILNAAEAMGPSVANGSSKLRSRGEVVMRALEASSAAEAASWIAELEEGAYNPFQLLVADDREASLIVYRGASRTRMLDAGIHVVGNVEEQNVEEQRTHAVLGAAQSDVSAGSIDLGVPGDSEEPRARKLMRIRERVEKKLAEPGRDLLEDLAGICREHVEEDPFASTCVHVADRYGTRSSLLLELAERRESSRFWATDGPPCERPFEDRTSLLGELGF
jgi:uncharacterized protein with NRDE domain